MMWLIVIPLVTVLYCVWNWWPSIQRMRARCKAGSKIRPLITNCHWLLGNLPEIQRLGSDGFTKLILDFKRVHPEQRMSVVWRTRFDPEFRLLHPDLIRKVLRTADPKAKRFNMDYGFLTSWLGDGLLLGTGRKWERNRKLLTPGFHFNVLKPYMEIYNKSTDVLLDKLTKDSESVEMFPTMALCTFEILLQCALSYQSAIQTQGKSHPYVRGVADLAVGMQKRFLNPFLYPDSIFNLSKVGRDYNSTLDFVHVFAERIIDKRMQDRKDNPDNGEKRYLDFLDILLAARDEDGLGLSKAEIRDEVDTFMFAGHDTTASASTWLLYAIAKHPDVQERICEEIETVLGDRENVEWDDLPNMPYFADALKESLRMYPPVTYIARELIEPLTVDGVTIPASSTVGIAIYSLHHSEDYWDKPEEFRPKRYEEESFAKRDPYCYVPFSAGPRNCIGQSFAQHELKVIVPRIVRRFKITLDPDNEVIPYQFLVLKSKNGIRLNFTLRN